MTTHGLPHVGSELRRTYLTELEAAYGHAGRRFAMPRNTALDECERLRGLIRKFRTALEKHVRIERRTSKGWAPTLDDCKAVQAITTAAERAVAMEERLRKMIENERKGYTPEQLEAVWRDNLRRTAADLGAEEWWDMIRIAFGDDVARVMVRMRWGEQVLAGLEGS